MKIPRNRRNSLGSVEKLKVEMNWENIETISQFDDDNEETYHENAFELNRNDGSGDNSRSGQFNLKDNADLLPKEPNLSTSLLIESLIHLVCHVLEKDPNHALDSYKKICEQLHKIHLIDNSYSHNGFEETRSRYQMEIYKIICAVSGRDIPISLPASETDSNTQAVETCWSRYYKEFDEIEFIAKGGFGKVFKARHKLDCTEYAVKQIKINSTTIKLCHLTEVKTIAKLNHPNIVQYKAAWLEPYLLHGNENSLKTIKSADSSSSSQYTEETTEDSEDKSEITSTDDDKRICEYNSRNNCSTDVTTSQRSKPKLAILYIQMSLCQMTLRNWLDERNECANFEEFYFTFFGTDGSCSISHLDVVNDIFSQILAGLNYIHSKNIVHHDIKPSNIFIGLENNGKLIAQLGDFGLACPLQDEHRNIPVGTLTYAAPEQIKGQCNPKNDIYSLGIVLIELLLKLKTEMERCIVIADAKKGIFPKELSKQSIQLVKSLLTNNVKKRPSTDDILDIIKKIKLEENIRDLYISQMDLKLKDAKINELNEKINSLSAICTKYSNEIETLKTELHQKDEKITKLDNLLRWKHKKLMKLKGKLKKLKTPLRKE